MIEFLPLPGMRGLVPLCYECGEPVEPHELVKIWDNRAWEPLPGHLCPDCRSRYVRCSACGALVHEDDVQYGPDDEPYCPRCFEERFYVCYSCGDPIPVGEEVWSPDGEPYHPECAAGIFVRCSVCGEPIWEEDAHYDEDGEPYCDACYRERHGVHEYSYKPSPIFHKLSYENTVYIGLELEVTTEDKEWAAENLRDWDPGEERFYIKEDSSISYGFEIVTHPFTWKAHRKEFRWAEFLKGLRELNVGVDASCGLHVHISRSVLPERARGWGRVLLLVHKLKDLLTVWSERDLRSLREWSSFWTWDKVEEYLVHGTPNFDRYRVVNFTAETVEIRLWAATLEHKKIVAVIQFADAVVEFARWVSSAFLLRASPDTVRNLFLNFLKVHGYHHAWESLGEVEE